MNPEIVVKADTIPHNYRDIRGKNSTIKSSDGTTVTDNEISIGNLFESMVDYRVSRLNN